MANAVRGSGVALRPHAKSHKCPEIAKRQVALGAVGICCQKVDEAAAFVEAGIRDVLVTNEIVTATKLARLAGLARTATIGVLADDLNVVASISAAATKAGATIDVLVEIDVGAHRCGVVPGPLAVALAQAVQASPGLRFRGLHAYHGAAQHLRKPAERRAAIVAAANLARDTRDLLTAAGIACPTVTGAGTGTWQLERDSRVYTELQPGSYIFMDADYGRNALAPDDHAFEQSLYVAATVMSAPAPERAIVDAGLKAFAMDSGLPACPRRARSRVCRCIGRAWRAARGSRPVEARHRRARMAYPRPLRPDGQPLRLDRRRPRRRRRMRVAGRGARGAGIAPQSGGRRAAVAPAIRAL